MGPPLLQMEIEFEVLEIPQSFFRCARLSWWCELDRSSRMLIQWETKKCSKM